MHVGFNKTKRCFDLNVNGKKGIVAGVVGALLQVFESIGVRGQGPFILVESVAGLSILLVFIFAAAGLNNVGIWPVSVIMAILWITSFVNLINAIDPVHCSGLRVLEQRSHIDICGQYKVAVGFIFASFLAWIFGLIEVRGAEGRSANLD